MTLFCLLAVAMCELCPRLQSARIKRVIAQEIQSSGHSVDAVADDKELLACVVAGTMDKIIIEGKDKPFWDYYYTKGDYFTTITAHRKIMSPLVEQITQKNLVSLSHRNPNPRSIDCETYTPPPKPSSTLRNLTTALLRFDSSAVHCRPCGFSSFTVKFLEMCSRARTIEQFNMVNEHVEKKGGSCKVSHYMRNPLSHNTLQSCMKLNLPHGYLTGQRRFAACKVESEADT